MIVVRRLKNSRKGTPYRVERRKCANTKVAKKQIATWWESGGTLAVVTITNGAVGEVTLRAYAVEERVPKGWTSTKDFTEIATNKVKRLNPKQPTTAPIIVYRLKTISVPPGDDEPTHYAMDTATNLPDLTQANAQAMTWWQIEETLAIVVMIGDSEDARYAKPGIDESKVPDVWPKPPQNDRRALPLDQQGPGSAEAEDVGLLFNPVSPRSARQTVEEGKAKCPCCFGDYPPPLDAEDRDQSPTGRMTDRRCPRCGRLLGGDQRAIWDMYMGYQRRLTKMAEARPKPWN